MTPIAKAPQWLLDVASKSGDDPPIRPPLSIVRDDHNIAANSQIKYVRAGFQKELDYLAGAQPGSQSQDLNKSAFKIGTLVGTGLLSRDEAEQALLNTALSFPNQSGREPWTQKTASQQIKSGLDAGIKKPRALPEPAKKVLLKGRMAREYIRGVVEPASDEDEEEIPSTDEDEKAVNDGIYAILNGRTVLTVQKTKTKETGSNETTSRDFVADFAASIVGEVRDESGVALYEIEGRTRFGYSFNLELPAAKWSAPPQLASALKNVAGAGISIFAGQEKHLGPSIDSFTDRSKLRISRRFNRTGWTKDGKEFLIPGMEAPDVTITLPPELPYRVIPPSPGATRLEPDQEMALRALLEAHRPELTTMGLTHALLAPFAPLGRFADDKFGLFVVGRTGSFKTSWTLLLMSIYGEFIEDKILKFGMGGTANALMSYFSEASDMPLMIDNFKPGTGQGQKDAQTLIHGVSEGGDKKRLNQDGSRKKSKDIHCWGVFTGEATLEDSAAVARTLIVSAQWDGDAPPALTEAQALEAHLPAIGGAWLSWLLTDDAKIVASYARSKFARLRTKWAAFLRSCSKDMVNTGRVASSLALCEVGWEAARACPFLEPILKDYQKHFDRALDECARGMAIQTTQTHEANKYLAALHSLLVTNRAYVANIFSDPSHDDRRPFLGWEDADTLYLQADAVFKEVLAFLRDSNGLNGLGMTTIHRQLDQLGYLAKSREGRHTMLKKVGPAGKAERLLWIKKSSVFEHDGDEDEAG